MNETYRSKEEFLYDFIDETLRQQVLDVVNGYPDDGSLFEVQFTQLDAIRPKEAEQILLDPKDWMEAGQRALQRFIGEEHIEAADKSIDLRGIKFTFAGLPEACRLPISTLRAEDRGKLLVTDGQVRSVKEREEQLTVGVFTCSACEQETKVVQESANIREPSRCGMCGTKKPFFKLNPRRSVYTNLQEVMLQQQIEDLENGASPKSVILRLVEDHIDILAPGDRVTVSGIYSGEHEKRSRTIKTWVDVIAVKKKGEEVFQFKPDSNFIERAKAFAAAEPIGSILDITAGDIYGRGFEKTAILCSIVGGVRRINSRGKIRRGDIHVLLIGDPGLAKSALMKLMRRIAPRSIFASGKGTSAAGLTAAAVKDEFGKGGGFAIEAGVLVMANMGTAFIDELDKMGKEDRSVMHDALEDQVVTITKAGGAKATLPSRCGLVGAANPKGSRFDPDEPLMPQFDIPDSLVTRFDLIVAMRDIKNKDADAALADHMGDLELQQKKPVSADLEFVKQYVAYVKRLEPELTVEAVDLCKAYYKTIRSAAENVTARQLEGLFRLSEASAKLHMRDKVTKPDAEFAINLHKEYVRLVGRDPVTGEMDLGMVSGLGHTLGQEGRVKAILAAIRELGKGKGWASEDDVVTRLTTLGIPEESVHKTIRFLLDRKLFRPGGGGTLGIL